ncbi:Dcp1-like decapping [Nosema bombycis CQ1]|uniref:Dcp1-like decapping n=1 Tax=Nosema bombycis (strain CQ1 / CVCC 102059) TaxID=578461 RepID=R0MHJ7_NOSB1|nr:Dcp1-like decapping [Nosema bombycis CQ1]|eukprot:EOB12273.1 Dcp1-like decapping [Nosema bombycis CQ1]
MNRNLQNDLIARYVRHVDRTAQKILFYTKTSSVYKYEDNKWISTGIEGTCVIYLKSSNQNVLCVFNRKKHDDFFLCLGNNTKVEREGDIVIFKNKTIYGIWFCDNDALETVISLTAF